MSAVLTTDSVFDAVNSGKYSSELPEEREYSIGLQLLAEGLSFGFIYVSGFFIRLPVQHATNLLRIQRLVSSSDYSLSNTDLAPLPPPSGLFSSSYRKGDVNEETALASLYTAQNINRPPLLTGFFDAFRALFSFKSEGKYFGALYRGNLLETIESYVSAKIKLAVFDQLSTLTGADMEGMIEIDENELKGMTRQQVNDYISELAEEKSKTLPIIFTKNNLCGVVSESIAASVTLPFTTLFRRFLFFSFIIFFCLNIEFFFIFILFIFFFYTALGTLMHLLLIVKIDGMLFLDLIGLVCSLVVEILPGALILYFQMDF